MIFVGWSKLAEEIGSTDGETHPDPPLTCEKQHATCEILHSWNYKQFDCRNHGGYNPKTWLNRAQKNTGVHLQVKMK